MHYQAKDLFQVQADLVEAKVDMAVNQAVDRVITQIVTLRGEIRNEMHELKHDLSSSLHELSTRLTAVETKLGMVGHIEMERRDIDKEIRKRMIEYTFRGGWTIGVALVTYLVAYITFHWHTF